MLYIGLMSGTSADGMDGALVDLDDGRFRLLATLTRPFTPEIKEAIESVVHLFPDVNKAQIERLDRALAADFARLAKDLSHKTGRGEQVMAIGSHGQTIYHGPGDKPPVTIQIGDPRSIAELIGITTVGHFRSNDLRAGGQGAPLAPAFHNAMFRDSAANRMIVNIGGIANVTSLPADPAAAVLGFDTGPGNTLMDQWCRVCAGHPYDEDGRWAAGGQAPTKFVEALLSDPYFDLPAPKSTGREYFHLDWMKSRYPAWNKEQPVDIQAGLLEVTARSIARGVQDLHSSGRHEMYICGGGAWNTVLMNRLAELIACPVATTETLGLSPDWVEACAFAWLACRRIHGRPGNLPSVTGAAREVLLGEIYTPAGQPARPGT